MGCEYVCYYVYAFIRIVSPSQLLGAMESSKKVAVNALTHAFIQSIFQSISPSHFPPKLEQVKDGDETKQLIIFNFF